MSEPSRSELIAWADEAQAYIDAGDVRPSELRKANATVAALRAAAKPERERVIEFALQPFIDGLSGTEAAKMIDKRYPGLSPIQIVVTKFQYQAAKDALKGTPA